MKRQKTSEFSREILYFQKWIPFEKLIFLKQRNIFHCYIGKFSVKKIKRFSILRWNVSALCIPPDNSNICISWWIEFHRILPSLRILKITLHYLLLLNDAHTLFVTKVASYVGFLMGALKEKIIKGCQGIMRLNIFQIEKLKMIRVSSPFVWMK